MGETSKTLLPDYQDGSFTSNLKLELHRYLSVFTYKGKLHLVPGPDPMHANVGLKAIFWRVAVESLSMFFFSSSSGLVPVPHFTMCSPFFLRSA